jgi:hypothetical protein
MNMRHQMKRVFCGTCLMAVAAVAGLGWAPHDAVAQVAVAAPAPVPQALAQQVLQQLAGAFAPGGDDGEAIGDPWWDEAEAKRPAAEEKAPPDAEAEGDEGDAPADAQAMLQEQLRAQAQQIAQQLRQQGLTILRRELSLVRQSCPSLEKQQRALVLEAGRGAIDRAVDEQLQAAGGGRRRPTKRTDPEAAIRDALKASVKANAADAELASYEAEHRLQEDRRKAAVVAAIVAEVDREAYLDDAERQALSTALAESYRARWRQAIAALEQQGMVAPDENILPGLERCVEKALGKERKARWVAARDEARKLTQAAGMQPMQFLGDGIQVQAPVFVPPAQPAVRRVIRRQIRADGGGVQVQVEVQAGAVAEAGAAEDEPEDDKEDEK